MRRGQRGRQRRRGGAAAGCHLRRCPRRRRRPAIHRRIHQVEGGAQLQGWEGQGRQEREALGARQQSRGSSLAKPTATLQPQPAAAAGRKSVPEAYLYCSNVFIASHPPAPVCAHGPAGPAGTATSSPGTCTWYQTVQVTRCAMAATRSRGAAPQGCGCGSGRAAMGAAS